MILIKNLKDLHNTIRMALFQDIQTILVLRTRN